MKKIQNIKQYDFFKNIEDREETFRTSTLREEKH